jgi:hypothetical protein
MTNTTPPAAFTPSNPSTAAVSQTPRVDGRFCTPQQDWGEEQQDSDEDEFFDVMVEIEDDEVPAEIEMPTETEDIQMLDEDSADVSIGFSSPELVVGLTHLAVGLV